MRALWCASHRQRAWLFGNRAFGRRPVPFFRRGRRRESRPRVPPGGCPRSRLGPSRCLPPLMDVKAPVRRNRYF